MKIQLVAQTDFGKERSNNEDNFIVVPQLNDAGKIFSNGEIISPDEKGTLLVVCDGMGGQNAGEVASQIAVVTIKNYFTENKIGDSEIEIKKSLAESLLLANKKIIQHAKDNPETKNMGTTAVLAYLKNGFAYISWTGDSRAYYYSTLHGLKQISKDHSMVQGLIDRGQLTEEQAFYHPQNNVIMQSLGDPANKPKPGFVIRELFDGDIILLCSDGLNGMLHNHEIEKILKEQNDLVACAAKLIDDANAAGGHDNITVALSRITESGKVAVELNTADPADPLSTLPTETRSHIKRNLLIVTVLFLIASACAYYFFMKRKSTKAPANKQDTVVVKTDTLKEKKK